MHRLAQALRTEDPTKAGRDVLLTLEPAEQAQGVSLVTSHCDGFDADAVSVAVDRLDAPLGEGVDLALECGRHVALVGIVSFWRRAAAAPDSKAAKAAIARAVKRARAWA